MKNLPFFLFFGLLFFLILPDKAYSQNPSLIWGTYDSISGSFSGTATDKYGYIYIFGGGSLLKFSPNDSLIWAKYFGDNEAALGNSVVIDTSGDIIISGQTNSYSGLATSGAYQSTGDTTIGSGFLAKFNSSGGCYGRLILVIAWEAVMVFTRRLLRIFQVIFI